MRELIKPRARRVFTAALINTQTPLLECVNGSIIGEMVIPQWSIWIDYNRDKTAGTRLILFSDGSIHQEVIQPDDTHHAVQITPSLWRVER